MNKELLITDMPLPCKVHYISAKTTHSLACVPILNPSIMWVKKGTKKLVRQNNEEVIDAGNIILLPALSEFYITNNASKNGYLAEVISLSNELIEAFINKNELSLQYNHHKSRHTNLRYGVHPTPYLKKALSDLIQSIEVQAPKSIIYSYLNVVFMALHEDGKLDLLITNIDNGVLLSEKVKKAVLTQPDINWSVTKLADRFNMSSATFRRHLANENKSFRQILDDVRLGLALSAVQDNKLSIQEITLQVGYQCPSNFSAKFKRRYGMSPTDLRKTI